MAPTKKHKSLITNYFKKVKKQSVEYGSVTFDQGIGVSNRFELLSSESEGESNYFAGLRKKKSLKRKANQNSEDEQPEKRILINLPPWTEEAENVMEKFRVEIDTKVNAGTVWSQIAEKMMGAGYGVTKKQCYDHHYKYNVLKVPALSRKYRGIRDHLKNESLTMVPPWTPESRQAANEAIQAVLQHTEKGKRGFWYSTADEMTDRGFRIDKNDMFKHNSREEMIKEHDVPAGNEGVPYSKEDVNRLVTIYQKVTSQCDRGWWAKIATEYNATAD